MCEIEILVHWLTPLQKLLEKSPSSLIFLAIVQPGNRRVLEHRQRSLNACHAVPTSQSKPGFMNHLSIRSIDIERQPKSSADMASKTLSSVLYPNCRSFYWLPPTIKHRCSRSLYQGAASPSVFSHASFVHCVGSHAHADVSTPTDAGQSINIRNAYPWYAGKCRYDIRTVKYMLPIHAGCPVPPPTSQFYS